MNDELYALITQLDEMNRIDNLWDEDYAQLASDEARIQYIKSLLVEIEQGGTSEIAQAIKESWQNLTEEEKQTEASKLRDALAKMTPQEENELRSIFGVPQSDGVIRPPSEEWQRQMKEDEKTAEEFCKRSGLDLYYARKEEERRTKSQEEGEQATLAEAVMEKAKGYLEKRKRQREDSKE